VFGNNVEEALGWLRFLLFYVLCGAAAALTMGLIEPSSDIPMIGASGAISAVLAAYLLLYPRARILVVIPLGFILYPAKLSAFWVLGAWFLLQLAAALLTVPGEPGIAWWAHFGGFVCGIVLVWLLHRPEFPLFGTVQIIPKGAWARQLTDPKNQRKP
jgi:membrane associated rhomboid family serine protease